MKKIILASNSPRRKTLLSQIGLKFKVIPSNYQENMVSNLSPRELAKRLSRGKAEAVAKIKNNRNSIIIAADTFVVFRNKVLGKPKNRQEARHMLHILSGRQHSVITGYTIIDTATLKIISRAIETKIYMRPYSEKEISAYLKTGEPFDKAGAYAIQGLGGNLIKKIEGDFFNVMGLPLFELIDDLKKIRVKILS